MFELKISADEPLIGVLGRIANGLEAVAESGVRPSSVQMEQAAEDDFVAPIPAPQETPTLPAEEPDAKGPRSRPTKEEMQAKRDAAKAAVLAAGLTLEAVEADLKKPVDSWVTKDCEKAHAMANSRAGKPNTEEQAKAIGEHQRVQIDALLAEVKAKYADAATAEALFKAQLKAAFGVEFPHQATHVPDFSTNLEKLTTAINALPGDPKAPAAPAASAPPAPETPPAPATPPAPETASALSAQQEARIAFVQGLPPLSQFYMAETQKLIVTLLSEDQMLAVEDVRAICYALVQHGRISNDRIKVLISAAAGKEGGAVSDVPESGRIGLLDAFIAELSGPGGF